jgi:MOSC domain-containing protein YiiM
VEVISINVGRPATLTSGERSVLTSIVKSPVSGRVHAGRFNIQGDQQADLRVHGGIHKAVYAYPSEHYGYWRELLREESMPWGMFGENLTTAGVVESDIHIGDRLRIGNAVFEITQPRMPCFKLALRFRRAEMVKLFWASGRSGFYLSVVEEGDLEAGNAVERVQTGRHAISVAEIVRLYRDSDTPRERLKLALETPLAGSWKTKLRERLTSDQGHLFENDIAAG